MIEDFMDASLLHEVCNEFPEENRIDWDVMVDKDQKKFSANKTELLGPATRNSTSFSE